MNSTLKLHAPSIPKEKERIRKLGLYDTFVIPEYRCPHCGHKYKADLQTKAFGDRFVGGWMETVKLGQDLRKPVRRIFLWYSTAGFLSKKISKAEAEKLAKDKKHYIVEKFGDGYLVCKVLKSTPIVFACKSRIFELYDSCPKCKKWIEEKGVIRNWKFVGIRGKKEKRERAHCV